MTIQVADIMLADASGLLLVPILLGAIAFWIWMIIDCIKCEKEGSTKIAWLLVILFASVIGAPLYFFIRKLRRTSHSDFQPAAPVYQPWNKDKPIG